MEAGHRRHDPPARDHEARGRTESIAPSSLSCLSQFALRKDVAPQRVNFAKKHLGR